MVLLNLHGQDPVLLEKFICAQTLYMYCMYNYTRLPWKPQLVWKYFVCGNILSGCWVQWDIQRTHRDERSTCTWQTPLSSWQHLQSFLDHGLLGKSCEVSVRALYHLQTKTMKFKIIENPNASCHFDLTLLCKGSVYIHDCVFIICPYSQGFH